MITIFNKQWKPQKLANDKAGEIINWEQRIPDVENWMISNKYDGNRVEIIDGQAYSRELNLIKSVHVQEMAYRLAERSKHSGIIEAEFYDPTMNWSEIQHFFKTEDVTSPPTWSKYNKLWNRTVGQPKYNAKGVNIGWKFPGRNVEWATSWHESSRFYVFDEVYENEIRTKEERYKDLCVSFQGGLYTTETALVNQYIPSHIEEIYQAYDQCILDGGEGLVAMRRKSLYKPGRITLLENVGYKIKDSNVEFFGIITGVEEGTIAKDGTAKTLNAFGRSKTSQLKEDRIPSGLAKGFAVKMDDSRELIVSLNGFDHTERQHILYEPFNWVGKKIMFTGMNPVKPGGMPRSSHYTKEDVS